MMIAGEDKMGMERDNEMIKALLIQFKDEFNPGENGVKPESEKEDYHIYLLLNVGFIAEMAAHYDTVIMPAQATKI